MYKKLIMEARFEAIPMTGRTVSSYLEREDGYVDVGGFSVQVPGYKEEVPFDFEATSLITEKDGTYVFGNADGFVEKIHDVDPCHEDDWAKNGLKKEEITAKLLGSADTLTEFNFNLCDMQDEIIPCFLNVKDMIFFDEVGEKHCIRPDVLDAYNKLRVAEQVADFIETEKHFAVDSSVREAVIDAYVKKFQSKDPAGVLAVMESIQHLDCYGSKNKRCADFMIDCMMQVADSKDAIYRVSLMACGNPDYGENPNSLLLGTGAMYFYCDSLEGCRKAAMQYIKKNDLGGGHWAGGLVYRGNEYIGGISYNGRFWDKEEPHYSLPRLCKTDIMKFDRQLRESMPMFYKAVEQQVENSKNKQKIKVEEKNRMER